VQLSTNPPGGKGVSADEIVRNIESICKAVDGIFIYHPPSLPVSWEKAKKVIEKVHKLK
jgi:hypothetical protein